MRAARFLAIVGALLVVGSASAAAATNDPAPGYKVTIWTTPIRQGSVFPFANIPVWHWSEPQTVLIVNTGDVPLVFEGASPVTLSGPDADEYYLLQQPHGTLAPGAWTAFEVKFKANSFGVHTATVTIRTNDSAAPTFSFALQSTSGCMCLAVPDQTTALS